MAKLRKDEMPRSEITAGNSSSFRNLPLSQFQLSESSDFQDFSFSKFQLFEISNMSRLPEQFRARTKSFASRVVRLFVSLPRSREEVAILGRQLLRSGTSVAAHVREASRARSDNEFCSKIEGAIQEADESILWLELLRDDCGVSSEGLSWLHTEADELLAIMITMVAKTARNSEMPESRNAERSKLR